MPESVLALRTVQHKVEMLAASLGTWFMLPCVENTLFLLQAKILNPGDIKAFFSVFLKTISGNVPSAVEGQGYV